LWFSLILLCTGLLDDPVVRRGFHSHRLLSQAEEELTSTLGFSPVEPEGELVEVVVQMLVTDRALVGPHQPSFEQRDDSVDPRQ